MRIRPRLAAAVAPLSLAFALASATAPPARAQFDGAVEGEYVRNAQMARKLLASRASRLGTSAGPDPDTVYVGKSATDHTGPGNYWNLYVGTYRPGTNVANN